MREKRKLATHARLNQIVKFHKNPLVDLLYKERLRRILDLMGFGTQKKSILVDIGCGKGYFTRVLSSLSMAIGIDIRKGAITAAKESSRKPHFIIADICFLPFRKHSIDAVVCASVLEHIKDLDSAAKQMKDVLKKHGLLLAGYPIETKLFKII